MLPRCVIPALGFVCAASFLLHAQTAPAPAEVILRSGAAVPVARGAAAPLKFDGSAVTLDRPWQFHIGDNPAWASPDFGQEDDITVLTLSFAPVEVAHA
jgi:hypothetical protein